MGCGCNCGAEKEHNTRPNTAENDDANEKRIKRILSIRLILSASAFLSGVVLKSAGLDPADTILFLVSYIVISYDIIITAVKNILKGQIFDENFLMATASLCAAGIGEYPEAAAVMLFYQAGEKLQDAAVERSRRSISALSGLRPDFANVKRDGGEEKVNPGDVKTGEIITVRPGEKIPLDGTVLNGSASLNTAAITGESEPRNVTPGSEILSGCVCVDSVIEITVTKEYADSAVQKILRLCETAQEKKSKTERFITRFARVYTPAVCACALVIGAVIPLLFKLDFTDWINRGLIFLVASCPCALVVSVPLAYFCGIGKASRLGVLVKGGNYLDILANVRTALFDKTGTLTQGQFSVTKIIPSETGGVSETELVDIAGMIEFNSNHSIAAAIKKACTNTTPPPKDARFRETAGMGTALEIETDGKKDVYLAGNTKLVSVPESARFRNSTAVHISKNNAYLGTLLLSDTPRRNSAKLMSELKKAGIKSVILTGDVSEKAESTAAVLATDEFHGDLLPQDKYELLEKYERELPPKGTLLFMGDGINDAPVLARADIGVAMGGIGSDAAVESADAVIMNDDPYKIVPAILTAKRTVSVAKENIIFALSVKFAVMLLAVLGLNHMWLAVFADVGVTLCAVFNAVIRINRQTN
jgi:Cd2+/Zn2+-exporting ATPase